MQVGDSFSVPVADNEQSYDVVSRLRSAARYHTLAHEGLKFTIRVIKMKRNKECVRVWRAQ